MQQPLANRCRVLYLEILIPENVGGHGDGGLVRWGPPIGLLTWLGEGTVDAEAKTGGLNTTME